MLLNLNKVDNTTNKSYVEISFLNYLRKVCEKIVVDMLLEWFETGHELHECQM